MNSKTLDTALISLSVGCLVIGIYEVISRGFGFAYVWIMLSVMLWLGYNFKKRIQKSSEDSSKTEKATKQSAATSGKARKPASKNGRKRK